MTSMSSPSSDSTILGLFKNNVQPSPLKDLCHQYGWRNDLALLLKLRAELFSIGIHPERCSKNILLLGMLTSSIFEGAGNNSFTSLELSLMNATPTQSQKPALGCEGNQ